MNVSMDSLNPEYNMKWKNKYPIGWCSLCECVYISCPEGGCSGTSCNAMGCEKCSKDFKEFNEEVKGTYEEYLTEEECEIVMKANYIREYMLHSIRHGEKEINWKRMKEDGLLCEHSEKLFAKEISKQSV